jgi:histidinol phosphatase-like enzyme
MKHIDNELVVVVDVDGTLIKPDPNGTISLPYGSEIQKFSAIKVHVDLVKEYKKRGFYVIVWSMGGAAWARGAVEALKLERFVDQTMCKPSKHVDDRDDVGSIIGTRVFIGEQK